jgi:hypothetical protein
MFILLKAFKYFHRSQPLPKLPRQLVTEFDPSCCSDDELIVFMAGAARDRHHVARLMRRYCVSTAAELLPLLPKTKPPSLRKRVLDWLRRLEGSTAYDPLAHSHNIQRRELKRELQGGVRWRRMH